MCNLIAIENKIQCDDFTSLGIWVTSCFLWYQYNNSYLYSVLFVWALPPSIFSTTNIPVQFEALINITCVEKVLCHFTCWVVYRLYVTNTLKDHILIYVLQILIMPQHVWHFLRLKKTLCHLWYFVLVFFLLNNELQPNHEILLIIYCLWIKWAISIDNYTKKERKNIAL